MVNILGPSPLDGKLALIKVDPKAPLPVRSSSSYGPVRTQKRKHGRRSLPPWECWRDNLRKAVFNRVAERSPMPMCDCIPEVVVPDHKSHPWALPPYQYVQIVPEGPKGCLEYGHWYPEEIPYTPDLIDRYGKEAKEVDRYPEPTPALCDAPRTARRVRLDCGHYPTPMTIFEHRWVNEHVYQTCVVWAATFVYVIRAGWTLSAIGKHQSDCVNYQSWFIGRRADIDSRRYTRLPNHRLVRAITLTVCNKCEDRGIRTHVQDCVDELNLLPIRTLRFLRSGPCQFPWDVGCLVTDFLFQALESCGKVHCVSIEPASESEEEESEPEGEDIDDSELEA